jgi:hypothetical protein
MHTVGQKSLPKSDSQRGRFVLGPAKSRQLGIVVNQSIVRDRNPVSTLFGESQMPPRIKAGHRNFRAMLNLTPNLTLWLVGVGL